MDDDRRTADDDTRKLPIVRDVIALAGTVGVPDGKRNVGRGEVIRQTWAERSRKRHRLGGVDRDQA